MTKAMRVLVFGGIGPAGVDIPNRLARLTGLSTIVVPYSRSYGPIGGNGQPYQLTLREGFRAGRELLDDGVPSIIIGYSAGAHIAGDLAWSEHPSIVGAILISDPMQPESATFGNGLSGIAGQLDARGKILLHRTTSVNRGPKCPIRWVSQPRDVICQCPFDSPLRDLADFSEWLSARPNDRRQLVLDVRADLAERIRRPRSLFEIIGQGRRYSRAAGDALGYLSGEHNLYGANFPVLARWARELG